ncbi:MAG: hypothetical protein ABR980_03575 [Ignavibacteriaceae bacterium]|jgi:hypothetical protein
MPKLVKICRLKCLCSLTNIQPFCEDTRCGTGIRPLNVRFDEGKIIVWCGHKKFSLIPFNDGIMNKNKRDKL